MTLQNVVQSSILTALPNSFVQAIIILGHCQLVVVSILIVCTESNNGSTPPFYYIYGCIPGCFAAIFRARAWLLPPTGSSTASASLLHVGFPNLFTWL